MTEPTPLTLYLGQFYAVTVAEPPPPFVAGGLKPVAWSQNDGRWRHSEYAPGFTFGQAGCLVCCVAMVASLAYAEAPTPVDVAAQLRQAGAFDGGLLTRPGRIPSAYARLTWGGYLHWRTAPAQLTVIAQEIARYRATIIEVVWDPKKATPPQGGNQHFVIAIGVLGGERPDVLIIDPWDGLEKRLTESPYARPTGWDAVRAVHGLRLVRAGL